MSAVGGTDTVSDAAYAIILVIATGLGIASVGVMLYVLLVGIVRAIRCIVREIRYILGPYGRE